VLKTYALIAHQSHNHHGSELAAQLHRGEHITRAHQQLNDLIRDLVTEGAQAGEIRDDIAPEELAAYCLHALTAAGGLISEPAVHRLVTVTLAGLRNPRSDAARPPTEPLQVAPPPGSSSTVAVAHP